MECFRLIAIDLQHIADDGTWGICDVGTAISCGTQSTHV